MMAEQLKERDSFAGTPVWPQQLNGTGYTGTVDMSKFNRVEFLGVIGTQIPTGNVQAYIGQTNNSNGASNTNIAGGAIVNIATPNTVFSIEVRADQLVARYVMGTITVNTAATYVSMFPIATEARYMPDTSNDVSPSQRVAV